MSPAADPSPRRAGAADAAALARLLHDFQVEFDSPSPGPTELERRLRALISSGELVAVLGGEGPDGFAQLRLRKAVVTEGLDAYIEEFYVAPAKRGRGLGRAILAKAMEVARELGAKRIELGTDEGDKAAQAVYEKAGFSNRSGGELMFFYERDL